MMTMYIYQTQDVIFVKNISNNTWSKVDDTYKDKLHYLKIILLHTALAEVIDVKMAF